MNTFEIAMVREIYVDLEWEAVCTVYGRPAHRSIALVTLFRINSPEVERRQIEQQRKAALAPDNSLIGKALRHFRRRLALYRMGQILHQGATL